MCNEDACRVSIAEGLSQSVSMMVSCTGNAGGRSDVKMDIPRISYKNAICFIGPKKNLLQIGDRDFLQDRLDEMTLPMVPNTTSKQALGPTDQKRNKMFRFSSC